MRMSVEEIIVEARIEPTNCPYCGAKLSQSDPNDLCEHRELLYERYYCPRCGWKGCKRCWLQEMDFIMRSDYKKMVIKERLAKKGLKPWFER